MQLVAARDAVFRSWQNERAKTYRRINHIDDWLGTAVNVQAMVFGNLGENSGTGVGFTRNPATGEHMFFGEYLMNAQGEDVVSGVRTPLPISELNRTQPSAQAGQSSKASGVAGEVGVPHSSVDLHYFKGCKEPRGDTYSMRGGEAKDAGMAGATRIVTPNKVRELQIALYRKPDE